MTNEQILQTIQKLVQERDKVAQGYQETINIILRAANQYVAAKNEHIATLQGLLKAEPDDGHDPTA